ncbi:MAG: DNA (cytosine-5-)-methyltransferase [Oscillospiraceae bacterium]|jgi:DNA (cytosine-5)-methyltransferase 1|nr:DNA (cytosine-5-)-methyltransferase [Oscillospiraceae bacterium]
MQTDKKNKLTFMDFCSGIGAGRLGIERGMGAVCVGYSEIMESSIKTYKKIHNTENEKNYGDLTTIKTAELPSFDIMIAGFPCQTFSIIGQRQGLEDDRGQIIYHLVRILKDKNVPYFILENVKGLINHDKGKTIRTIVKLLENAGYYTGYKVLNSVKYGVPQMRERVYFIGIKKDKLTHGKFIWPNEIKTPDVSEYLCDENPALLDVNDFTFQKYLNNKYNKNRVNVNDLLKKDYLVIDTRQSDLRTYEGKVPTLRTGRHGILYVKNNMLCKLSGFESLLLQGFDKDLSNKAVKETTMQLLLSQAGNAMTVSVIEQISSKLLEYTKRGS